MDNNFSHAIACVVINKEGKILLLKRAHNKKLAPDKWFVVGAYPLKSNENFESFTHGELIDEIGCDGVILKKGRIITSKVDGVSMNIHTFLAEISIETITLNHEHSEYKWVTLQEIKNFDTVSGVFELVASLLDK